MDECLTDTKLKQRIEKHLLNAPMASVKKFIYTKRIQKIEEK
jgi:hypothetical protein